jgi:hypothetical protein
MILSTQNSSVMELEDLLLSKKQLQATNIKVKKIYGVWNTKVFWGVTLSLCEYFISLRRLCDPSKCRNNQQLHSVTSSATLLS